MHSILLTSIYLKACLFILLSSLGRYVLRMIVINRLYYILQAAWIVDDSDEEDSYSNEADDGMVLDEEEGDFPNQDGAKNLNLDDDRSFLNLKDSDEETDVDSMMMVGFSML